MLTGPDFGLVRTAMLSKLKAFWVVSARRFGESWCLHLAFPRRRRHCGPPKLVQRTWHFRGRESSRYEMPNSSRYMERWVGP